MSALAYVDKTLAPGEEVVYRARFPWIYSFWSWVWLILLFWCAIGFVIFIARTVNRKTTEIAVTNRRFVVKTGLFTRQTQEVALEKIEEIKLAQSFWGRLFDYGSISISGTGVSKIQLPNIDEPLMLRKAINSARSAHDENHPGLV